MLAGLSQAVTGKPAAQTIRVRCVTCHRGVAIPRQLQDIIWQTTIEQGPDAAVSQVLSDLESNGQAALVFARPPDERACQVKGTFTSARPASEAERAGVEAQWDRWRDRLASIGVARATLEPWITWPCTAIRVRVTAIFNQTPGPNAGAPLA